MKARLLIFLFFFHFGHSLFSQNGVWTWMKGSSLPNVSGSFGVQGVPAPSNEPPAVYGPNSWTDLNGNFWVLGGLDALGGYHNSLWKYDPVVNIWTWMKGPSVVNQNGVYGTQGVPSPANYPGCRAFGSVTWTDLSGDLWMFGGYGNDAFGNGGEMNDLWRYRIATNEWTWMSGSNTVGSAGNFGILQVPSPANMPSSRSETTAGWVDANGDLWMFGGTIYDDIWRYSIAANTWTWMAGSSTPGSLPVFGVQGLAAPTNTPGQRWVYAHWKDQQGAFWIFGGLVGPNGLGTDMWKYEPASNLWTWMAGTNTNADTTSFSVQCSPGGLPYSTYESRAYWQDDCGRFWYFGGASFYGTHSEIWIFDPANNLFTWVTGSLAPYLPGNFGVQGVPAPSNYPESVIGAPAFRNQNGELFFFAGAQPQPNDYYNSIWRYQIDPVCPGGIAVSALFSTSPAQQGCAPYTVQFNPAATGLNNYNWDFGDTTLTSDTSSAVNPSWTFTQAGSYTVTLIVSDSSSCGQQNNDTSTITIQIFDQPGVNLGNDTTICSLPLNLILDAGNTGMLYQWNTGAISQTIAVNSPGIFSVTVSSDSANTCTSTDTITISITQQPELGADTSICSGQSITLNPGILGQYTWSTGDTSQSITVNASGLYSVQINNPPCLLTDSIILTVLPAPFVNLGSDTMLCPGDSVLLDAGNPGSVYNWSTGSNAQSIAVNSSGTFAVTVTCLANCIDYDTITISFADSVSFGERISLCQFPNGITLDAGNPGASYIWSTGETSQTISVNQPGNYTVTITNNSCLITDSISVEGFPGEAVLYVPNTFTPNRDGLNEIFTAKGESVISFKMSVFNRWGELIFETNNINAGWDGTYKGALVQEDTYVFLIEYTAECSIQQLIRLHGHVNVIR